MDDVYLPLEDEDGYIQCNNLSVSRGCDLGLHCKSDSNIARKLSPSPPRVFIVPRRPFGEPSDSQQWSMGSRKRSKSLERLSAVSTRPSRGGDAGATPDFSTAPRRRRQAQSKQEASPSPRGAPRIPPRPAEQLLNRFRTNISSSTPDPSPPSARRSHAHIPSGSRAAAAALPKKKYVELDVGGGSKQNKGTTGGGGGGRAAAGTNSRSSPRLVSSRPGQQRRTSYAVLQIDGTATTAATPPPPSRFVVQRRERTGARPEVKRCQSTATERSIVVQRDPHPRYSAAYPTYHHHQHSQHLETTQQGTPGVSLSPRKPRKLSAPTPPSGEQNSSSELVKPVLEAEGSSTGSSLHIIDLRSGTTVFKGDGSSPQVQRPPPPVRKPPSRPPAPIPRPRKNLPGKPHKTPLTKANTSTDLEPYVAMSSAECASLASTTTARLPNDGAKNSTPLPQEWRRRGGGGEERVPTPDSEPLDFEAYSYVDLVKNRHLLDRNGSGQGVAETAGGTASRTTGEQAAQSSVCVLCYRGTSE